jgi:hypothetical protein
MKKRRIIFVLLLIILTCLFGVLYFIGVINFFEFDILKTLKIFDFSAFGKLFSLIYLIIVTIFCVLIIAIIARIFISLKYENMELTSMNIDELSIQKQNNPENFSSSVEKLVTSLDKNINVIQKYTEVIDADINKIDNARIKASMQEMIDQLYQNFSQMINDLLQCSTVSELLEKILLWGVSISNSKRGSVMVLDNGKELYVFKTVGWSDEEKEKINDIKIPLGAGIAGRVASENKRIFVTNIENYSEHDFKYKDKYKTKSFISMPITGIKKVIAVLNLTEDKDGLYSMNELECLNIITRLSSKIFELIQVKKKSLR